MSLAGKRNRGLSVVASLRHLVGAELKDEDVQNAIILGWCVEWVSTRYRLIQA